MFRRWFAIDPGAHTLRIYDFTSERTFTIRSILGFNYKRIDRAGMDALEYTYKEKPRYQVKYPLNQGRINQDISLLIKKGLERLQASKYLFRPSFLVAVPHKFSSADKKRWEEILMEAGARKVEFIDRSHLLQVDDICFAVHAGYSSTTVYITFEDQTLACRDLPFGGSTMDQAIINTIAQKYRILISQEEAMRARHQASQLLKNEKNGVIQVKGLSRQNVMQEITLRAMTLWPCMEESEKQIVLWAKSCFDPLPLEIRQELLKSGIYLSGGLARCFGLEPMLEHEFNAPVHISKNPENYLLQHMKGWK